MDDPFMEHPTGEFATAIEPMEDAIARLRALPTGMSGSLFAQDEGNRPDSIHVAEIRLRANELDPGAVAFDTWGAERRRMAGRLLFRT